MNIRAKCRFDKETIRALTHVSAYKKSNPRKTLTVRMILCIFLLVITLAEILFIGFDPVFFLIFFAVLLVIFLDCFMYFLLPVIQYKALVRLQNIENEYLFCDDALLVTSNGAAFSGESRVEYPVFVKVFETSRYFFLFQTKNQVYPVDKSSLESGCADEIRNKLKEFVKNQYKICKY